MEHDYTTWEQRDLEAFPSPDDLWGRLRKAEGLANDGDAETLLFPFDRQLHNPDGSIKVPRYYSVPHSRRTNFTVRVQLSDSAL